MRSSAAHVHPTGNPRHFLLTVGLALLLVGCQGGGGRGSEQVRGVIVAVQARSVAQADMVTVRADDGRELIFQVDSSVDVTPGHLREHMTLAEPVLVTYQRENGGLLARRIDDG